MFLIGDFIEGLEGIFHIFPDALFVGSGFLALTTLSYSFAVLFFGVLEGTLIFHGIHKLNEHLQIIPTILMEGNASDCKPRLSGVSIQSLSVFDTGSVSAFPSAHVYMVAFFVSYLVSILLYFRDELEILSASYGELFQTRLYVSIVGFACILFSTMCYRLFKQCDTFSSIIVTLFLGLFVGTFVAIQNSSLLGKESINLLGVPILRRKDENGNDLYVCSPN
jgi:hypothetical protein